MPDTTPTRFLRSLVLALAVAFVPTMLSAQAQDQPAQDQAPPEPAIQQTPQCTMQASPVQVASGEAAVEAAFEISDEFGAISSAEPSPESGLALASGEEIPRADLAAGDEETEPVQMSAEGSSATVWLNTEDAEAGTYEIELQGERGSCIANVSVTEGAR